MICPNCQKEQDVKENSFGALYTCHSCQAVYFINFDGQPEFGDVNLDIESRDLVSKNNQDFTANNNVIAPQLRKDLSALDQNSSWSAVSDIPDTALEPIASFSETGPEVDSFESSVEFSNRDVNMSSDYSLSLSGLDSQSIAKDSLANKSFSEVAKDIADYGNTETQIAHLNYEVRISGIDTADIKKLLKEAIEDSRFGWDVNEVLKTIKNGELILEKLNPVKAYVLAKRLQFIDIEQNWKQNAVG